jgi:hypothetical protein
LSAAYSNIIALAELFPIRTAISGWHPTTVQLWQGNFLLAPFMRHTGSKGYKRVFPSSLPIQMKLLIDGR